MFMGDTGSQFLGVFLAFVGIRFFWNAPSIEGDWEPVTASDQRRHRRSCFQSWIPPW